MACLFLQGDPAALLYHDMYVNENDHLATAFRIMKETGVLGGLEADAYRIVRAVMIDMVLKVPLLVNAFNVFPIALCQYVRMNR